MRRRETSVKTLLHNYYVFLRDFFSDLFDDKLGHYASSLSWSTLFSLVPLLVILLAIFTSLPLFDSVYNEIRALVFSNLMPTDSKIVIEYLDAFIQSADTLGTIGAIYIFFAVVMFFKNYDYIVNDIFNTLPRTLWSAITRYLLLLVTIPLMLGSSFWLSASAQIYLDKTELTSLIQLYTLLPYLIAWATFYLLYQLSANTSIDVSAAVISSFISSLVWYLSKSAFVFYVLHNKTYATIYGNISILLFFFVWIYISWAIFIHGLKFCDLLNRNEEIEKI